MEYCATVRRTGNHRVRDRHITEIFEANGAIVVRQSVGGGVRVCVGVQQEEEWSA